MVSERGAFRSLGNEPGSPGQPAERRHHSGDAGPPHEQMVRRPLSGSSGLLRVVEPAGGDRQLGRVAV
jgi:hypothetical protein